MDKIDIKSIFGRTRKTRIIVIISIVVGIILLILNFILFSEIAQIFTTLNLVSALIILGPSLLLRYNEYKLMKEVESRFPDFLRDITEGIAAGMTLPQSIKNAKRNNYGALTPYVNKMAVQMDWGVPFEDILKVFGEKSGSKVMKRTVSTIIETHRSGGNIVNVLRAVAGSIVQIDKIKKERASHVYAQMITGYTIFFVFLGVMIGLQNFLIPSLTFTGTAELGVGTPGSDVGYKDMFRWLIVIQGLFSGLAIGKMAEGSVIGGFKHSLVLVAVGYAAFGLFA